MHELSIAKSLVELATQHAVNNGADRIVSLTLRLGALSCVHKSALEFSFELIAEGTILAGATLKYIDVPVAIYCSECDREVELSGIQSFRCPTCDTSSGDIRRGKSLDLESIECVSGNASAPAKRPTNLEVYQ